MNEIREQHKAKGETGNTPGEFLWKFFKTDHLLPVITVVVYLGSDDWDGPRTLHDLFNLENSAFLKHSADYKLNLIEPLRMNEIEISKFQTDMRELLLYMNAAKNKQKLLQLAKNGRLRDVNPITAHLINEVSNSKIRIKKGKVKIMAKKSIKDLELKVMESQYGRLISVLKHKYEKAVKNGYQKYLIQF